MRIVAGRFKGAQLQTPEGETTRPTTDRAREGLFNILAHGSYANRLRGATALELFAGTGALGLEAISRGAAHCDFVENDRQAYTLLRANIEKCRASKYAKAIQADAYSYKPQKPYDIIFLDPPYHVGAVERVLASLEESPEIGANSLIVTQSDPKTRIEISDNWRVLDDRKYGAARFQLIESDNE